MININWIEFLFGGFCASLFFLADYIDNSMVDVVAATDYQALLLKTKKVILEKKGLIREISTLKGEIEILTKQNNEFILQGVKTLEVIKDKNLEIAANMDLLDKYENAFVQFNKERKDMCEILDKYKDNLQKLLDWKHKAVQTMDNQANEISRLKKINLQMLVELKKYKKD